MNRSMSLYRAAVLAAVTTGLVGCSSGSSGLSTASFLPGPSKPKEADPVTDRALQVAATSARATKCGYNFDASRLKSSYIAYETGQGAPTDRVAKIYDTAHASVHSKIGPSETYCTDEQTAKIKADLTRHLAGDFSAPVRKPEVASDWWKSNSDNKPWDSKEAFCPKTASCI